MRCASMGYEIEFKLIDIKDINKIQCVEETEGPFGDANSASSDHRFR